MKGTMIIFVGLSILIFVFGITILFSEDTIVNIIKSIKNKRG